MAYHHSGYSARGLNNSFHRRRSLLKRILQERAESVSTAAQPTLALIIGAGGAPTIQPMGETPASHSEAASASRVTSGHVSTAINPQREPDVFGGDNGQVALRQPEAEEPPAQTPTSTLKPSADNGSPSATPLAIHRTLRPSQSQPESFREAYSSPSVLSLLVSPISGSLPPLLGSLTSAGASGSPPTSVRSSTGSLGPASTGIDDASSAPPLSQNPPIIVGILMVVLIVVAAVVALVSWLTRSARRRRKNRLEALTFKTDISEEDLAKMDSHPFEETDMEEAMDYARPNRNPVVPFYIEPHSTIFSHENYPEDTELHDSMRAPEGAYPPAFSSDNTTSHQPPHNGIRFGDQTLLQPGSRPKTASIAHPEPWKHDPNFLSRDNQSIAQASSLAVNEQDVITSTSKSGESGSSNDLLDLPPGNALLGVSQPLPRSGLSWANALRSNLVSALDVVKHATGAANSPPASVEDRFTPLPPRPGRDVSSENPQRKGTQEEYDLTFSRARSQARSTLSATRSREHSESEEEAEGLGALQTRCSQSSAQRVAAIGGLGRFSFEQRMANSRSQTLNSGFRNDPKNGMAVYSTALSRRRSGMASGSDSSSHSMLGSDLGADATMRMRRPNVA